MTRAILLSCWPCLAAMLVAFGTLSLLVRLSGARWNLPHLRMLHACQKGSTQTVSFVLTLPVFIMVVLFIVQMSQLMIGTTVVHYAAFAAARSASVWIPASLISEMRGGRDLEEEHRYDPANLFQGFEPGQLGNPMTIDQVAGQSNKLRKIWLAAVNACAVASPSRPLYQDQSDSLNSPQFAALYQSLAPASQRNTKTTSRLRNKLTYSAQNTLVSLRWVEKDCAMGPTYNPYDTIPAPNGDPIHRYHRNEIGWDDPLTITVQHRFALLPGPGRLLATRLARADGDRDNVSGRIMVLGNSTGGEQFYGTLLSASVTFTNEGLKSVIPYVEHEE